MIRQYAVEESWIEISCQIDSLLPLPLTASKISDYQPVVLHQCVHVSEHRCSPVTQSVLSPARMAPLTDTIRIG
ncbi:hypothetical protein SB5_14760 [Pseudomonas oryzihabitans]|nr:hypothetical protein SB5_14760 [Pseudomonas psychrotolerans]